MANPFEQFKKPKNRPGPTRDRAEDPFKRFAPPPKPAEPSWLEQAGGFGLDVMRNFNDTLTMGTYNKALEATGIDPNADEKLAASSGASQVLGDTLGYVLPGMGMSAAVGKAIPQLAGNTIPKTMGREAMAAGALSGTEDLVREGSVDPWGVATDTAFGGLLSGGIAGIGRAISPGSRVRAAGNGLSDADKLGAEFDMRSAADMGIPLTIPEALTDAGPRAVPMRRMYDDALQAPKGSQVAQEFEATREPMMADIGREMVDSLGPGATPFEVSAASEAALLRNRQSVTAAAQPDYDAASRRRIPPTHVPTKDPGFPEAVRSLTSDSTKMRKLQQEWQRLGGQGKIPQHSTLFLDAVKKEADSLASGAYGGSRPDPFLGSIFGETSENIRTRVDRVNPRYSVARGIAEEGGERVRNLEAGPLGRVAKNPTAKGQGSTIFGVDNATDANLSRMALDELAVQDAGLPRGILANQIDSAVSTNPGNWPNTALPSPHAKGIAMGVAPDVIDTARFRAASMVDPHTGSSLPGHDGGLIAPIVAGVRNLGKGKIARIMQDPDFVKNLGRTGPVQRGITQGAVGTQTTSRKRRNRRNRRNRGEN